MNKFQPAGEGDYGVHSEDGVEWFETQDEANDEAKRLIEECETSDGWAEGVAEIYVFKVLAQAKPKDVLEKPAATELDDESFDKEGIDWSGDHGYIGDWELTPVLEPETAETQTH